MDCMLQIMAGGSGHVAAWTNLPHLPMMRSLVIGILCKNRARGERTALSKLPFYFPANTVELDCFQVTYEPLERRDSGSLPNSGIFNDYANETSVASRYPFYLLRRVITVSLKKMKIVRTMPPLEI